MQASASDHLSCICARVWLVQWSGRLEAEQFTKNGAGKVEFRTSRGARLCGRPRDCRTIYASISKVSVSSRCDIDEVDGVAVSKLFSPKFNVSLEIFVERVQCTFKL